MDSTTLPENKPLINGKYKTRNAIKTAIYNAFIKNKVEGVYSDENWSGIKKLESVLEDNDIPFSIIGSEYIGHKKISSSTLPTKKIYQFGLSVRDKEGKNIPLELRITCCFVGKTGTMADSQYELTYYFTS